MQPSKYTASQKKDEAAVQGQESDDKYDDMMDNQLGPDIDMVLERDDNELVMYMSVKMTDVEDMHPLERLIKGFTDLVHYVCIYVLISG